MRIRMHALSGARFFPSEPLTHESNTPGWQAKLALAHSSAGSRGQFRNQREEIKNSSMRCSMKLEVIIIKLALVRLAPWPRPSTNRLINRLINRLLQLFALHRPLYTLYALLTFPASAGFVKFLCPPHQRHIRWFVGWIRLWFAPCRAITP